MNTPDDEKSYSAIGDTEYATTFRVDNPAGTPVEVLKVYRIASVEREEGAAGFAADVRALRSVDTPALVTPQEAGLTDAGAPYIRRSWIGSPSLADQLAQGSKLSTSDAVTVAVNLADVVSAMNNKRLLHLGVSPQNLFVRPDLSILLTDPLPRSTFLALQHARKERTAHVAPEILSGEPAKPASDSYSIMSTLMAALGDRELPESLELLRDRCLADRPADRPMPGELAQLLREVGPSVEEFELTASQTAASAGATGEPGTGRTGNTETGGTGETGETGTGKTGTGETGETGDSSNAQRVEETSGAVKQRVITPPEVASQPTAPQRQRKPIGWILAAVAVAALLVFLITRNPDSSSKTPSESTPNKEETQKLEGSKAARDSAQASAVKPDSENPQPLFNLKVTDWTTYEGPNNQVQLRVGFEAENGSDVDVTLPDGPGARLALIVSENSNFVGPTGLNLADRELALTPAAFGVSDSKSATLRAIPANPAGYVENFTSADGASVSSRPSLMAATAVKAQSVLKNEPVGATEVTFYMPRGEEAGDIIAYGIALLDEEDNLLAFAPASDWPGENIDQR